MRFSKYPSITNSYSKRFIEQIYQCGKASGLWVANEKIYGANCSLWTDGNDVKVGKRSGILPHGSEGSFYRSDIVLASFQERALQVFDDIRKADHTVSHIAIQGEIYGGMYDHPDVERKDNVPRVQKGVSYSPNIEFACFDIKVFRGTSDEEGELLNYLKVVDLCDSNDIPMPPEIVRGTLDEILGTDDEFDSRVPGDLHDLPSIEGNTCEGIVLKPTQPAFTFAGKRIILKKKNDKFREREKVPKAQRKPPEELPEDVMAVVEIGSTYVTENRLRNVISKIGLPSEGDFGKVMGMMNNDVVEELLEENPEFEALSKKKRKQAMKSLGRMNAKLLRDSWMAILSGEF